MSTTKKRKLILKRYDGGLVAMGYLKQRAFDDLNIVTYRCPSCNNGYDSPQDWAEDAAYRMATIIYEVLPGYDNSFKNNHAIPVEIVLGALHCMPSRTCQRCALRDQNLTTTLERLWAAFELPGVEAAMHVMMAKAGFEWDAEYAGYDAPKIMHYDPQQPDFWPGLSRDPWVACA